MKKLISILLLLLSFNLFAQEDDFFSDDLDFDSMDFDEMFSDDDDSFIEVVEDQSDQISEEVNKLLTTTGVEWGGSFSASITSGLVYSDYPALGDLFDNTVFEESFSPSLSAELHFNARPDEDIRFYGKFTTEVPFYQTAGIPVEGTFNTSTNDFTYVDVSVPDITIYELFSDFNYDNKLFFRVGKQNAKWGVGYFYSPADFLSLESIDPTDPEAEREGPIAIKMSIPFGLNNLSAFITVPNSIFEDSDPSVTDLIIAPVFQILLGDTELTTGLYYQKESAPRGMLTATTAISNYFGRFSFFGEAVGLYGSDKTFINEDYTTTTYEDKLFFNGTAGMMWSKTILENSFTAIVQYYYNGEGYDEAGADIVATAIDAYTAFSSGSATVEQAGIAASLLSSEISYSDLSSRNRHYLAATFAISNLFDNDDLSLSSYTLMNVVDRSGLASVSLSYSILDELTTTLTTQFNYSGNSGEYDSDDFSISLGFDLGSGSF